MAPTPEKDHLMINAVKLKLMSKTSFISKYFALLHPFHKDNQTEALNTIIKPDLCSFTKRRLLSQMPDFDHS